MKITQKQISELQLDPNNARRHSSRNLDSIAYSLKMFGQRKPIVVHNGIVIAGNGTLEAAKQLGWTEISVTEVPENWDVETAKAFAIADNRTAELAEWDEQVLVSQLLELESDGWDIKEFAFDDDLMKALENQASESTPMPYSNKVTIPQYEIVGDEPTLDELYDTTKADELKAKILELNINSTIQDFLVMAANRHVVFNYKKIAEYYPHQSAEVQKLMEDSALVIIDVDNAIANGFANFLTTIEEYDRQDDDD